MDKLLLTTREAGELIGISRDRVYRLINSGEPASFKVGGLRRIARESAHDYVNRKLREARDTVA